MGEWYRKTRWDERIEAGFEAKLARSRGQRAQYLRIQGSILKESHPAAALHLLRRCIESGDEFHVAAAWLDSAQTHYAVGDVEQALVALEAAIEQEARHPIARTSARFDWLMLVALHERTERYEPAVALLEELAPALFPVMDFQREGARAVILSARGCVGEARAAAERALAAEAVQVGWEPGHPQVGVVPNRDNPLSLRLREIAAQAR